MKLLTDFLDTSGFYFCSTSDLSHSCQRQAEKKINEKVSDNITHIHIHTHS